MKRFKFSFETLEKVRKARENEALRVLAEAQTKQRLAVEEKNRFISDLHGSLERRAAIASGTQNLIGIGTSPLQIEDLFIEGQKIRIQRQETVIFRAMKQVEKAMRAYLLTRRATRMIERLREKALEEHRAAVKKFEQRELDDLILMRNRFKDPAGKESA